VEPNRSGKRGLFRMPFRRDKGTTIRPPSVVSPATQITAEAPAGPSTPH
jgi:outer membrane protein assembly factor BamD